jgi:hypothetical protein
MPENIDTRVSPALDPETYRAVEGYNDETRPFLDGVVNAFSEIHRTVGAAHDARARAESNPAWTPENRVLIVARDVETARQRSVTRLANAERDLRANIAHTEKLLNEPLTERAGQGTLNAEVRSFVRGLKRPEREKFMSDALARGDEATLGAVLGGLHYLSGLTSEDHSHYTHLFHVKKNPQLVARLDVMRRVLAIVERNGPVVHLQFDKAIGAQPRAVADLKSLDDQAKAALAKLRAETTA